MTLAQVELLTIGLSLASLLCVLCRQVYIRYRGRSRDKHALVLPLYFKFCAASWFAVASYGLAVAIGTKGQDANELPYWASAIAQGTIDSVSMSVGLFLAHKSAGSLAIRNSVIGGVVFGSQRLLFILVVIQHLDSHG
jgi:hypothetical protein